MERVRSLVRSDRRLTLRMISSELNLNWFTVHQIWTQDMRKLCAKMVPKNLTTEHKANRRDVCLDFLHRLERESKFFTCVITGDESWILEYDPETKRQNREWRTANSPRPKKTRMSKSKNSGNWFVVLPVSGPSTGNLCHQDTLKIKLLSGSPWKTQDEGGTVRPGIARTWMLHRDNTPCHTAVFINEFLAEKSIPVIPQPPYSTDLSPCNFFLFPRLKNHFKVRHFDTLDNIQKSVTDELKGIPAEAFQHCYEQWKQCLRCCVAAQGNYFEGDSLDL